MTGKVGELLRIPLSSAKASFADGSFIGMTKIKEPRQELLFPDDFDEYPGRGQFSRPKLIFRVRDSSLEGDEREWVVEPDWSNALDWFLRSEPSIMHLSPRARARRLAEISGIDESEARFRLMRHQRESSLLPGEDMPPLLENLWARKRVHLIRTQRLIIEDSDPEMERRQPAEAVNVYSDELAQILADALSQNSRVTQQLDGSFPQRILSADLESTPEEHQIRQRYEAQGQLREKLARVGLLNPKAEVRLPDRSLHDWERSVISTYLDDTDEKLGTFSEKDLLNKLTLLRELLDERFLFKTAEFNDKTGLLFQTTRGQLLKASMLSSGEQHQLVLLFDLIFKTPSGSLVLIDEPEISLHINWQERFVDDLREVAKINPFRFILATHSPQIVDRWWTQTHELSPGVGV